MANEYIKTPSEVAAEARQTGHDAMEAVQGHAAEARAIGQEAAASLRPHLQDARAAGAEALDTAKGVAEDAKDTARDAAAAGKAYVRSAVDAANQKLGVLQDKVATAQYTCTQYIAKEPVKATLMAVAGGALLTGILMSALRGRRS